MLIKLRDNEAQNVQINTQAQGKTQESRRQKASEKQQKKTVIFAGELPFHKDPIALRRQQAQKKALEFVKNAWNSDRLTDGSMAEYRALAEQQRKELQLNQERVRECDDRKEALRKGYGVEADSQEQKDLELLEKGRYPWMYGGDFTGEEEQRLEELRKIPLTEYQQKCLEIDKEKSIFDNRVSDAQIGVEVYSGAVTSMKVERLKFHKMADAQNNAKKVMEQAGREIQGMLVDDAKDHVDGTFEEQREEAEKKADEKEAQEEKIELRREQRELMEARIKEAQQENHDAEEAGKEQERDAREEASLLKDMAEAGMDVAGAGAAVQAEIKDMLNKMKLIEADIKGIEVDEEI